MGVHSFFDVGGYAGVERAVLAFEQIEVPHVHFRIIIYLRQSTLCRIMTWYNPFSWFTQGRFQEHLDSVRGRDSCAGTFYCANPECHKPIQGDFLLYEPSQRALVHEGDCRVLFVAYLAIQSEKFVTVNFDSISREQAVELAEQGNITSFCLEKRV